MRKFNVHGVMAHPAEGTFVLTDLREEIRVGINSGKLRGSKL